MAERERVGLIVDVDTNQAKQSIGELRDTLKRLKAEAQFEPDPKKLAIYNKEIKAVETEIKQLSNVGVKGFDAIGNKVESNTKGLGRMFGGLKMIANILPGVGIAGLLAFAIGPIMEWIGALLKASKAQQTLLDINNKAVEGYSKEVVSLKVLVAEHNDVTTSLTRKKEIQDKLQKDYPNYFSDLDKHADKEKYIKEQVDKVTQALIIQAKVQAAQGLLTEKFQDVLKKQLDPKTTVTQWQKALSGFSRTGAGDVLKKTAAQNVKGAEEEYNKFEKFITDFVTKSNSELSALGGDPKAKGDKKKTGTKTAAPKEPKEDPLIKEAIRLYAELEKLNNKHNLTLEEQERLSFFRRIEILKRLSKDKEKQFEIITVAETASQKDRAANAKIALDTQISEENKQRFDGVMNLATTLIPMHKGIEVNKTQLEADGAAARKGIAEQEAQHKKEMLDLISNLLSSASAIAGEHTAAGKAFGIASTLISTYTAAQQAYASQFLPIPDPSSPLRGTMAAAAAVLSGLARIKAIASVKVPGKGAAGFAGGTLATGSTGPATLNPALPTNITRLNKNDIDAMANQALRAFVVESDISNSQGRIQRIKRSAIFG